MTISDRAYKLADKHFELYVSTEHPQVTDAIQAAVEEALLEKDIPVQEATLWLSTLSTERLNTPSSKDAYVNLYAATTKLEENMVPFYSSAQSISRKDLETLVENYIAFKGYTDDFVRGIMERFL